MADPLRAFPFFSPSMRMYSAQFSFVISCNHYYLPQAQTLPDFSPHSVFSFVIPILLNFLGLKYNNPDKSPFQTRPQTLLLGTLSLLLYCFSYHYLQRIRMQGGRPVILAHVFRRCMLVFGYVAIAALASLLFPDSASPAVYALLVTISVGYVLYLVYRRILAQRNANQGQLLPLYSR